MAMNQNYTLQNYYSTIMQQVPVLLKYQFLCTFISGNDPNANDVRLDNYPALSRGLTLVCQSASVPKHQLTTTDVNFFAKRFTLPATQKFDHEWQCKLLLTHDLAIYSEFRQMAMQFSSLRMQGGGIRSIPNINIQMDLLDQFSQRGNTMSDPPRFVMVGAFPTKVDKIDLKYTDADSNAMTTNITWTYQYFYMDRNHDNSGDPLQYNPVI